MRPRILVVGSSNTDLIVRVPRIPAPGETVLGGEFVSAGGGKGANQAVSAARAGAEVTLVARVGDDTFGQMALEGFRKDGIAVDYVVTDRQQRSGVALILVGPAGQNTIAVAPGANSRLSAADVQRASEAFGAAQMVLVQLEVPLSAVQRAVELAAFHHVPVILNPAPAQPLPGELLRHVSILTPNAREATALTGIEVTNPESAARAAARRGRVGVPTATGTGGDEEARVGLSRLHVSGRAFRVGPVATQCAGGVLSGVLAVALAEGKPLLEAVRFASAAAAISVTRWGAQPSAPTRAEIEQFLKQHS